MFIIILCFSKYFIFDGSIIYFIYYSYDPVYLFWYFSYNIFTIFTNSLVWRNLRKSLSSIKFCQSLYPYLIDKSKYSYRNQKFLIVKSKYLDNDYDEKSYAEYKITNNYKALSTSYQTLASNVKIVFIVMKMKKKN